MDRLLGRVEETLIKDLSLKSSSLTGFYSKEVYALPRRQWYRVVSEGINKTVPYTLDAIKL